MYSIVHCAQNKRLMLKSYILAINKSIFSKKHYENIFYEKIINELHAWIGNHPHVIHSPNIKDSLSVKINGNLVNKQKHLPQISVQELHNDMTLLFLKDLFGARTADERICIGYE